MLHGYLPYLFSTEGVLLATAALVIILLYARRIVWYLFRFDADVAQVLSQKKSSEVRIGKIVEQMAPFLEDFPVDVHAHGSTTQFIGAPIDFIHFTDEGEVIFIEVKSGNSALSPSQRRIKKAIEAGNVRWLEYRVK